MQFKSSFLLSQELATRSYLQLTESSPHPNSLLSNLILTSYLCWGLPSDLISFIFSTEFCMNIYYLIIYLYLIKICTVVGGVKHLSQLKPSYIYWNLSTKWSWIKLLQDLKVKRTAMVLAFPPHWEQHLHLWQANTQICQWMKVVWMTHLMRCIFLFLIHLWKTSLFCLVST